MTESPLSQRSQQVAPVPGPQAPSSQASASPQVSLAGSSWYIVPQSSGQCDILSEAQLSGFTHSNLEKSPERELEEVQALEFWGPFKTREEAIAKRIGLIRRGKCKPA